MNVYGFYENFKGIKDMPIARLATGIRDKHGRVRILIEDQALYFGERLDHSLINTNKIRHFGIPISDNPYDSGRDFSIDHDDQFITFKLEVSTDSFKYLVPNNDEKHTYIHMVLTDSEIEWDPHGVEMTTTRTYGENYI